MGFLSSITVSQKKSAAFICFNIETKTHLWAFLFVVLVGWLVVSTLNWLVLFSIRFSCFTEIHSFGWFGLINVVVSKHVGSLQCST